MVLVVDSFSKKGYGVIYINRSDKCAIGKPIFLIIPAQIFRNSGQEKPRVYFVFQGFVSKEKSKHLG
jgi:hypothetical protein